MPECASTHLAKNIGEAEFGARNELIQANAVFYCLGEAQCVDRFYLACVQVNALR